MKKIEIPEYVRVLLDKLEKSDFEAYVVGGAVRSSLLGELPHDYDVTTSATPDEMKAVFCGFKVIETGLKHGTLTVLSEGHPVEITTYRVDGEYSDGRRPDGVSFTRNLEDDLARRDFTVNAMAYSEKRGLVDLYGGARDIENKIIRTVGDPEKRFSEDHLRILRAIRFASRLGFGIHPDTSAAMRHLASNMKILARERVYSEIRGIVCGEYAAEILNEYTDVVACVLEGFSGTKLLEKCKSSDFSVRLAMISDGFESEDAALSAVKSLKTDNKTLSVTSRLVKLLFSPDMITGERVIEYALQNGTEFALLATDVLCAKNAEIGRAARKLLVDRLSEGACFDVKSLKIKGADVIALGGSGTIVGEVLDKLLHLCANGYIANDRRILLEKAEEILDTIHE